MILCLAENIPSRGRRNANNIAAPALVRCCHLIFEHRIPCIPITQWIYFYFPGNFIFFQDAFSTVMSFYSIITRPLLKTNQGYSCGTLVFHLVPGNFSQIQQIPVKLSCLLNSADFFLQIQQFWSNSSKFSTSAYLCRPVCVNFEF